jgi:hypothetical protein
MVQAKMLLVGSSICRFSAVDSGGAGVVLSSSSGTAKGIRFLVVSLYFTA